ncbi:MAG: hypothetical protein GY913_20035 [Proteobacteria bacterium]|nr:hypothetical protein [Pseudomonadota bacterium]
MTLLTLLIACKDDTPTDSAEPWAPDLYCPGDPSGACADADGTLSAGASNRTLIPPCFETWEDVDGNGTWSSSADGFLDCGCDQICPDDEGWTGADEGEGDGEFAAVWMAGFGNGHPARGVGDDLSARTLVLRQGGTSVAIVSVDLVGFFNDDVIAVREAVAAEGLEIDHVLISATHTHEGPDTVGLWGRTVTKSGYDPEYVGWVRDEIVAGIRDAVADERAVSTARVGSADVRTYDEVKGSANVLRDTRDPVVAVWELGTLQLIDEDQATIATVIHWGSHPETLSDDNDLLSADFVHSLRETVESGAEWDSRSREGVGGTAIYLQGMVGGMMTTLRVETTTPDGDVLTGSSFEHTYAIGTLLGEMALDAVDSAATIEPDLSLAHTRFDLPVDNIAFQAMFKIGVLPRTLYNYDPDEDITDDNWPDVRTDMDLISLGDLTLLTIPGELFPEVALGGYDGSLTGSPLYDIVKDDNPNPPDLDQAPEGPYLLETIGAPDAWIVGLANDELGYIIPEFNFELHDTIPYLDEAEGDHYEETNSLGPQTAGLVTEQADRLLSWSP